MSLRISRDTRLCMSLSGRPGNFGTRFHNFLYEALRLDFVYKAFAIDDIAGAVAGIRALRVRGAAVSMPFKEAVIGHVDRMMPSAAAIGSVNTLVLDDGREQAAHRRKLQNLNVFRRQLAEHLDVSRQTVNAIETGKYDPSLPLAFRIARLFGMPIESIFEPEESRA